MVKATLTLNPAQLEKIRTVAVLKGKKTDRQSLVDLAFEIAIKSIEDEKGN